MALIHNLGFPRIGRQRELKFALENYWKGQLDAEGLEAQARSIRAENWQLQSDCDLVPAGDFSLYDHVLDTSFLLGNVPPRAAAQESAELDRYFQVARGRSGHEQCCNGVSAGEMTKWFDSNYHYIVPELTSDTHFSLNPQRLLAQIAEARQLGVAVKPVILGPVTYLWLSKCKDDSQPLDRLEPLLTVYRELLQLLAEQQVEWVQVDEPLLVTELSLEWKAALEHAYYVLQSRDIRVLLTSYFGRLGNNLEFACKLPVDGLHVDVVSQGHDEVVQLVDWLPAIKVLSLGVISGRNVWKSDLHSLLDWLEPVSGRLGDRLWLAPSCSLLHVPVDLDNETDLDAEIRSWLAFARQKLQELVILKAALEQGREAVANALADNRAAILSRRESGRVTNPGVRETLRSLKAADSQRLNPYPVRAAKQQARLQLPIYPTTTIGSFPQTAEIRRNRLRFRRGELDWSSYEACMQQEIARSIHEQEQLGLDVLVHGEAERNDMVEYFGEQLEGFVFSRNGWVQSYGSRCVKPPILFGDVSRPRAMTVDWIGYARSLTDKPVKGMLTGPVTILNWSFVRDDQPRSETCRQLALAMRQEVLDLEQAGCAIIQIDEAALREGLPLRRQEWGAYLDWAVEAFRLCANGVRDETQIHTHMCYSEFNDIIEAIADMDADVITIETSRSDMQLLDAFDRFCYPNEIGPGVYDIHSPNIPETGRMVALLQSAARRIPAERLWVNPDCGLKTRHWEEVRPALRNMVAAAQQLRHNKAAA